MINLNTKCKDFGITPKGIICIGSDNLKYLGLYLSIGFKSILYIEPDAEIYKELKLVINNPKVTAVNCVVSSTNSNNPVKRNISQLLREIKHDPQDYNIINIEPDYMTPDVLNGILSALKNISMIITNGKYDKELLLNYSLHDNLYISDYLIQVSTLGINGRFANQVFQHMFASCYGIEYSLKPEFPTWIGQQMFDINDYPITRSLEQITLENNLPKESLKNKDVIGWFQYHTSWYKPYRDYIIKKYEFKKDLEFTLSAAYEKLFQNRPVIAIHIRMEDYGYGDFFIAPIKWYIDWLESFMHDYENPILYIASDNNEIYKEFRDYSPITSKDFNLVVTVNYLIDFYVLTKANFLAISNSSFSFLASMFNQNKVLYYRPSLAADKLIHYDPWNSDILLREKYQPHQAPKQEKRTRKLHVGGTDPHPDWEILNIKNTKSINHVGDASNLYKFDDNTFDDIYASHILEHFDFKNLISILEEWKRVLKPKGTLYISVPNFTVISNLINNNSKDFIKQFTLMKMIFGAHTNQYDYHQMGFTRQLIEDFLETVGFVNITFIKEFNMFTDTSTMKYDDTLISLNVKANKK